MMGTALVITLGQLLSLAVLALVAGLGFWLWRRRLKHPPSSAFLETLLETSDGTSIAQLQAEIANLRAQVSQLGREVETLKASRPVTPQANYTQAIEMARQGQPVAEVANRCGVSRAEAELIVAMHGGKDKT